MKTTLGLLFLLQIVGVFSQERTITTSDGVDIYVKIEGQGSPCLYLHGGPGSGSHWFEKFMGSFLKQHFKMVYIDQRGVGRSSSPEDKNYSMDRMAKDFEEVREALGIKKWLTIGHSFGGILQVGYVKKYSASISGMLMINCTLNLEKSLHDSWIPKAYEFTGCKNLMPSSGDSVPILKRMSEVVQKLNEKGMMWKMAFALPENQDTLDATYKSIPNFNNDFSSKAMSIDDYWKDYTKETSNIEIPVLFFYGKTDWMVGPNHYKAIHFPDMLLWESNVGHIPFLENRKDLEKAIVTFTNKYRF